MKDLSILFALIAIVFIFIGSIFMGFVKSLFILLLLLLPFDLYKMIKYGVKRKDLNFQSFNDYKSNGASALMHIILTVFFLIFLYYKL